MNSDQDVDQAVVHQMMGDWRAE